MAIKNASVTLHLGIQSTGLTSQNSCRIIPDFLNFKKEYNRAVNEQTPNSATQQYLRDTVITINELINEVKRLSACVKDHDEKIN